MWSCPILGTTRRRGGGQRPRAGGLGLARGAGSAAAPGRDREALAKGSFELWRPGPLAGQDVRGLLHGLEGRRVGDEVGSARVNLGTQSLERCAIAEDIHVDSNGLRLIEAVRIE